MHLVAHTCCSQRRVPSTDRRCHSLGAKRGGHGLEMRRGDHQIRDQDIRNLGTSRMRSRRSRQLWCQMFVCLFVYMFVKIPEGRFSVGFREPAGYRTSEWGKNPLRTSDEMAGYPVCVEVAKRACEYEWVFECVNVGGTRFST